jgi:Caspase domain/Domain of unknown function (DUF4384)
VRGGHVRRSGSLSARRALLLTGVAALIGLAGPIPAAASERYVLLVGVGKYPALKPAYQLSGPPNDMRLVKEALQGDPFRVDPARITVLTDWQTDKTLLPTRGNIEREFARLASLVRKGDQVFILLGGHGSQQPADDDPNDFEPDGLDEIFLPADVQGWDGAKGRVINAIVDDEVRVWIEKIRTPGAFVWIAFDSCHSGTMIRGAPSTIERERQVPFEELIPLEVRRKVRPADRSRGGPGPSPSRGELGTDAGDVFALYAAQPYETTPESGEPSYGLFTSTMIEVLKQARSALTYRELAERITERYRTLNRIAPTPMFEGTGADREVLGQKSWPDRPQWTLAIDARKRPVVNAGHLHGLTRGSVLEVFPPAGSADAAAALGFVRVVELGPLESVVESVPFNSNPAVSPDRLTPGSRCRLTQADFGEMTLRIGLQRQPDSGDAESLPIASAPPIVAAGLNRLSGLTRGLARAVPSDADWFVRILTDGRVVLVPASGVQRPGPAQTPVNPATFEIARTIDETFESQLASTVTRLARARNLLAIAGRGSHQSVQGSPGIGLKVELLRHSQGGTGVPVDFGPEGRVLRVGERVAFRLTNTGDADIDATLLLVDAEFRILSLFPMRGSANNRLDRGKTYTTSVFDVEGPIGAEQVVAIAVQASSPPLSFAALEQDPLTQSRSGSTVAASPLGRLLDRALDGVGATRSLRATELSTHSITLLSWRTEPVR